MSRVAKRLHANGIPARVVDVLESDGGWLTRKGLAMALDAETESVSKALQRLHERGLVEVRRVELSANGWRDESRWEWRFIGWGEWS